MELAICYRFIFALLDHELSLQSWHRNHLMIRVLISTLPMPPRQWSVWALFFTRLAHTFRFFFVCVGWYTSSPSLTDFFLSAFLLSNHHFALHVKLDFHRHRLLYFLVASQIGPFDHVLVLHGSTIWTCFYTYMRLRFIPNVLNVQCSTRHRGTLSALELL